MEWTRETVLQKLRQQPWFDKFIKGEVGYLPICFNSLHVVILGKDIGSEFFYISNPKENMDKVLEVHKFMSIAIPELGRILEENRTKRLTGNDF